MTGNDQQPRSIVDRVKNILLQPAREWEVIDGEAETIGGLYRRYIIPLAAIPAVAGLIGMLAFGFSVMGFTYRPSVSSAVAAAVGAAEAAVAVGEQVQVLLRGFAPGHRQARARRYDPRRRACRAL